MFYEGTIRTLKNAIREKHPNIQSSYVDINEVKIIPISYVLWMLDKVEKMETSSIDDALKAARWMGWIFREIELRGIWTNNQTRNAVRADRLAGLDKPHTKLVEYKPLMKK